MPKLPGINHRDAVRVLRKAGFEIAHEGKHIVMTDGTRILTIPIVHDAGHRLGIDWVVPAGLTIEEFRKLL